MSPNIVIALSFISTGLLTFGLCIPLLQGKIKRNGFYGIRTHKAFQSDELWLKINRYGAKQMMIWSVVMAALGVATLFVPFNNNDVLGITLTAIILISVLIPTIQIFRYSKKL